MNKFFSHLIIQILIIVLGYLGVVQALPSLCAMGCSCCLTKESVEKQVDCCGGEVVFAGNQQEEHRHPPVHKVADERTALWHAEDGRAEHRHIPATEAVDCDYETSCSVKTESAAHDVRLAITGGQNHYVTSLSLPGCTEVVDGIADVSLTSEELRPYHLPTLTPPHIYTLNCVFLI